MDLEDIAELVDERSRIEKLGRIRQLLFGSLDGLLVPLGVCAAAGAHRPSNNNDAATTHFI